MRRTVAVLIVAFALSPFGHGFGLEATLEAMAEPDASEESQAVTQSDPRIGHYADETNKQGFILDRTREMARVRFDNSKEILVLKMVPGPQGVTYFKDEFDRTILRLMPYGGATVYDKGGDEDGAFGRDEDAEPLELKRRSVSHVERRAKEVQHRLHEKHALKVKLDFDPTLADLKAEEKLAREAPVLSFAAEASAPSAARTPSVSSAARMASQAPAKSAANQAADLEEVVILRSSGEAAKEGRAEARKKAKTATTVADAVEVLNVALKRLAKDDLAREVLGERIERITFKVSDSKAIAIEGTSLVISYVPGAGLDGRLSSVEIEQFLLENL